MVGVLSSAVMASNLCTPLKAALTLSSSSALAGTKLCAPNLCLRCPAPPSTQAPQRLEVLALKKVKGKVVCTTNNKTASVEVVRLYKHPKYKKRIKSSKKYHAHDEENKCRVGDVVTLIKCAPISKSKTFMVAEIVPKRKPPPVQDASSLEGSEPESEPEPVLVPEPEPEPEPVAA